MLPAFWLFSKRTGVSVHAHRRQFVLHRRAIGAGPGIGIAQDAAVLGMQDIELHALGQVDILGQEAKTMRFLAVGGFDVGDAPHSRHITLGFETIGHFRPPLLISTTRTLGLTSGRTKSILSNPFSNAADMTSMPSARTKDRKNCLAAMPRCRNVLSPASICLPRITNWRSSTVIAISSLAKPATAKVMRNPPSWPSSILYGG